MIRNERPVAALCREAGVSRQTAYKFRRRYEARGRAGLKDLPRANRGRRWLLAWRRRVLALRRRWPTWGGAKLRAHLRRRWPGRRWPSQRTIERWLAAAGLSRQRTVRDLYSKYLLTVTPASTRERQVRKILLEVFRKYGLPKIIRTDHGLPFCGPGPHRLTKLSLWWHRLGIKVQFVRRHEGINNNAHEQMHGVLQAEVAAHPAATFRAQCRALQAWQRVYNETRSHAALNHRTPAECYHPSKRPLPRLSAVRYPRDWLVRRVHRGGEIMLGQRRCIIGRAFARQRVGLRRRRDGHYVVYFGSLKLGLLNASSSGRTLLLHPAPKRRGG